MENFKEIYVVISYGGEYEDSWESVECAFNTKSRATNWINNRKYLSNTIGKDKFEEIENFIRFNVLKLILCLSHGGIAVHSPAMLRNSRYRF